MSQKLALLNGTEVELVAFAGENATLESDVAAPPGAPLELVVLGAPARLKVRRCQRVVEAEKVRFRIEGRWMNLSRVQRESLRV
jgi:hypothetical protein